MSCINLYHCDPDCERMFADRLDGLLRPPASSRASADRGGRKTGSKVLAPWVSHGNHIAPRDKKALTVWVKCRSV